jgi:transcription antitermination factor NusG
MAKRWYVVHVYSGFEKKIAQQIKEQAASKGLAEQFDEVLVPSEQVVEVRRGQKVNAEHKFFPGYVLVKMDLTDDAWHLVKNTPKVTGFLGTKLRPSPISEAEAEHERNDDADHLIRDQNEDRGNRHHHEHHHRGDHGLAARRPRDLLRLAAHFLQELER